MRAAQEDWRIASATRACFGLVVFEEDEVSAPTIQHLFHSSVDVHVARLPFSQSGDGPDTIAERLRGAAATILPSLPPRLIGFACTTQPLQIGEERLRAALTMSREAIGWVTPIDAALDALKALDSKHVAVITPYEEAPSRAIVESLSASGLDVSGLGFFAAPAAEIGSISADSIFMAARRCLAEAPADTLFLSCTGMRSMPLIEAMEKELGVRVISSLQVLAWRAAQMLGVPCRGPGQLFRVSVPNDERPSAF